MLGRYIVSTLADYVQADVILWMTGPGSLSRSRELNIMTTSLDLRRNKKDTARSQIKNTISGTALKHNEIVNRGDIWDGKAPHFDHTEIAREYGWNALLTVPLVSGQDNLGVLNLYGKKKNQFGPWEKRVVARFADQAAYTLQIHEEVLRLQRLAETGPELLKNLSEKALLKRATELALNIFCPDSVALYPYHTTRECFFVDQRVITGIFVALDASEEQIISSYGLGALVGKLGMLIISDIDNGLIDRSTLEDRAPGDEEILDRIGKIRSLKRNGIKAMVGICLRSSLKDGERPRLGILYFNFRNPKKFASEEIEAMKLFAQQVAHAQIHQRLYVEKEQKARQLLSVQEIALKILKKEHLRPLLHELVTQTMDMLTGTGGEIYLPAREATSWNLLPL